MLKLNDTQLKRSTSSGFSLIELLIVVAIILIIAAIAIPNLIRARIAANQASAVESCRTVTSAEVLYNVAYDNGFAPTLSALGGPVGGAASAANAQLIDEGPFLRREEWLPVHLCRDECGFYRRFPELHSERRSSGPDDGSEPLLHG